MRRYLVAFLVLTVFTALPASAQQYDIVIRGGAIYNGSGTKPFTGDIAILGDSIAAIGPVPPGAGKEEIDAKGLAVSAGFINMLSQSAEALLVDGEARSDVIQGVTLEVLGEGSSMGPLNAAMKARMLGAQGDLQYDITWNTLGEYLDRLQERGIGPNVASYIGASTVREYFLGLENRQPSGPVLDSMCLLVEHGMREGALGLSTALIYTPGNLASTEEIVALAKAAARYGGIYASHLRSEGDRLLEAVDELTHIARQAGIPAEIFHFKASGTRNWDKLDTAIAFIENARASGLEISADMYVYTAAATGLDAAMPPWVQTGGIDKWIDRLKNPAIRSRVKKEMTGPGQGWENFYFHAGSAERIQLNGFKTDSLKQYTGWTLQRLAAFRGQEPEDVIMDLVIQDGSRVEAIYFTMIEPNVWKIMKLPWVSFCSDEAAMAPEGAFLKAQPHPRAYGNFARLLGKYVRDQRRIPLEEAIRRLTTFPAEHLRLGRRGALRTGYFADIVVFDPSAMSDHASFELPHAYATGVKHVFINGAAVVRNGKHTGALPGRIVRGPGWRRP